MEKTALLKEMSLLIVFLSRRSYHQSCVAKIARKRTR
jgi:hypothetical protein